MTECQNRQKREPPQATALAISPLRLFARFSAGKPLAGRGQFNVAFLDFS